MGYLVDSIVIDQQQCVKVIECLSKLIKEDFEDDLAQYDLSVEC